MAAAKIIDDERLERREDFPVESFRYLEGKLQVLRKLLMDRAAMAAEMRSDFEDFYRVEKRDIDDALAECLDDPEKAYEALGLPFPREDGDR